MYDHALKTWTFLQRTYGQLTFGLIVLLVIWFWIVSPALERASEQTALIENAVKELNANTTTTKLTAEIQRDTAQTMRVTADTLRLTAEKLQVLYELNREDRRRQP